MWSFKKRPAPEPCFQIGQYQIDMKIEGMEGLSPLSREELEALGSTVQFRGEEILHAPAARFMEVEWDIDASEVFHCTSGTGCRFPGIDVRVSGPHPERLSYGSFVSFKDPDGNGWLLQEVTERLPRRV